MHPIITPVQTIIYIYITPWRLSLPSNIIISDIPTTTTSMYMFINYYKEVPNH